MPGAPRTDPGGRFSRTGLFTITRSRTARHVRAAEQVDSRNRFGLALVRARPFSASVCLLYPRQRHLETFQQPVEAPPRIAPSLAAAVQSFEQHSQRQRPVVAQALGVAYDPIVVPMALISHSALRRDGFWGIFKALFHFQNLDSSMPSNDRTARCVLFSSSWCSSQT